MALTDRIVEIAYELKDKFTGSVGKITGGFRNIERASADSSARVEKSNKRSEKSFFNLRKTVVSVSTGIVSALAGITGALLAVFNANKEFQKINASLKTVTGSAEAADEAFQLISDFSTTTPFQLSEVADAFIKLKALGLDPSEEALRSYGNTAAAMGKDLNQFIEAVADATTNEFERLKEFGIKAKQEGDNVSFTFQGVTTTVGKNAKEIESFLRGIGNVQFAGAMEEQINTIGGQLSNLKDSFFRLALDIGQSGASDAISGIMTDALAVVKQTSVSIIANAGLIRGAFNTLVGSVRLFGNAIVIIFNGVEIAAKILVKAIFGFAADINSALSSVTFGETSEEFARNAQFMRETMSDLEKGIDDDASSIFKAFDSIGTSFDQPVVENNIKENLDNVKPEVDVLLRPDVQSAIASINTARDAAQKQVKPVEVPVVFVNKNNNSFSDRPFNGSLDRAALSGGKR